MALASGGCRQALVARSAGHPLVERLVLLLERLEGAGGGACHGTL